MPSHKMRQYFNRTNLFRFSSFFLFFFLVTRPPWLWVHRARRRGPLNEIECVCVRYVYIQHFRWNDKVSTKRTRRRKKCGQISIFENCIKNWYCQSFSIKSIFPFVLGLHSSTVNPCISYVFIVRIFFFLFLLKIDDSAYTQFMANDSLSTSIWHLITYFHYHWLIFTVRLRPINRDGLWHRGSDTNCERCITFLTQNPNWKEP